VNALWDRYCVSSWNIWIAAGVVKSGADSLFRFRGCMRIRTAMSSCIRLPDKQHNANLPLPPFRLHHSSMLICPATKTRAKVEFYFISRLRMLYCYALYLLLLFMEETILYLYGLDKLSFVSFSFIWHFFFFPARFEILWVCWVQLEPRGENCLSCKTYLYIRGAFLISIISSII